VRNSRYRFTRLVMVIAAVLYVINGILLIARPDIFLGYLNVVSNSPLVWALKVTGVLVTALAVHQGTTSRYASDPALRRAALLSALCQVGLAVLTYTAPGPATSMRYALIGVSGLFGLLYLVTLPIAPVGYAETAKS
jgi:hypothetical protein